MNKTELRSKLVAAGAPKRENVSVLTDDGIALSVDVVGLTVEARGHLMNTCMHEDPETGEQVQDLARMVPEIVLRCAFVPDTNERVFEETDLEVISGLAASFLDPIFNKATQISGLAAKSLKVAEGNSDATQASASPSV